MDEDLKLLRDSLVRRHLGKRGIHGLSVDEDSRTLEVYVDNQPMWTAPSPVCARMPAI
jgi:hypothetical protein